MKLTTQAQKASKIAELEFNLPLVRDYIAEKNRLYYDKSDWTSASNSPITRIEIEIAAWQNDADEVEQVHHGVKINNRYIIGMNNKWSDKFKKWYFYKDINILLSSLLA